jgi:hypothetical protein
VQQQDGLAVATLQPAKSRVGWRNHGGLLQKAMRSVTA